MLEYLFPSAFKVKTMESNLDCKDKTIKALRVELDDIERKRDIQVENLNRSYEKEVQNLKDEIKHMRIEAELVSSEIDTAASLRIEREIDNADIKARATVHKEVETLKAELLTARTEAASHGASVDVIASLTGEVKSLHTVIDKLLAKLPEVDMTKFAVNVNVEPLDVNIVGGQRK